MEHKGTLSDLMWRGAFQAQDAQIFLDVLNWWYMDARNVCSKSNIRLGL